MFDKKKYRADLSYWTIQYLQKHGFVDDMTQVGYRVDTSGELVSVVGKKGETYAEVTFDEYKLFNVPSISNTKELEKAATKIKNHMNSNGSRTVFPFFSR